MNDHYTRLTIEPWDAMKSWLSQDQFEGFLRGNVIKYIARYPHKNGLDDIIKAKAYINKLIEATMLKEYKDFTRTTAIYPSAKSGSIAEIMYLSLGLSGEAGEVANHVKKLYRDTDSKDRRDKIAYELGDVFWYLIRLADALHLEVDEILRANMEKLEGRKARGTISGDGDVR